jgi:hypothetical protein
MASQVVNGQRKSPMCGSEKWVLLDGRSVLQALEVDWRHWRLFRNYDEANRHAFHLSLRSSVCRD